MNDSSGPHRLEELKSKVEKTMDTMSQLLEDESAGGGKQRDQKESGGTGRGAAHNYNRGAGRASPTADPDHGVTVGAPVAAEVPVHSKQRRAASKPTRPADDQKFQPAWAQRSTCTAANLESHI